MSSLFLVNRRKILHITLIGVNLNEGKNIKEVCMTSQETIPSDLFANIQRRQEISELAWHIITKVYHGETLSQEEQHYLASPSETAAILSVKYRRPIKQTYIKEMTRTFVNKETGHETPPRLKAARMIGGANVYLVKDVLNAKLREKSKSVK
jgi:hypothetical protein